VVVCFHCIEEKAFASFIKKKFSEGKITIDHGVIISILNITQCHSYYTQMLCSVLWDRNQQAGKIAQSAIECAVDELVARESFIYTVIWDGLAHHRRSVLMAIAGRDGQSIYANECIQSFHLRNSTSTQKAIHYMEEKGIIYKRNKRIYFSDIFFKHWILTHM